MRQYPTKTPNSNTKQSRSKHAKHAKGIASIGIIGSITANSETARAEVNPEDAGSIRFMPRFNQPRNRLEAAIRTAQAISP